MEQVKRKEKNSRKIKSKQINKKTIKKIFITIIIITLLFVIGIIANNYIVFDKNEKTNLIINNKNVTSNLKNDILIQDGIIYLSKADIGNFFDKYIYEEKDTNKIITTYEKKIAEIDFENNKMLYSDLLDMSDVRYIYDTVKAMDMDMMFELQADGVIYYFVEHQGYFERQRGCAECIYTRRYAPKSAAHLQAVPCHRSRSSKNDGGY